MSLSLKTFSYLLWALNFLLVLLFIVPLTELPPIFQFVGRLHPLVLHFPIGLLVIALLFEVLSHRGQKDFKASADLTLWLGAFTATFAAIAGFLLSVNGGYSGDSFDFHKWFGLATSLVAVVLIQLQSLKKAILPLYSVLVLLLIITGHFGASLTHGEDFLTEVFEESGSLILEAQAPVFSQVVMPVLEAKCISCHNPNKIKGGLLMDSQSSLMKGGEGGAIIIPGDLNKSKFISHTLLPMEDKLHMPPKGKSQLTNEEIKILSWWVENGASFTTNVNEIEASDPIQAVLTSYFAPEEEIDIAFATPQTLASLKSQGFNVKQTEPDKPYLTVYLGQRRALSSNEMKALRKIDEQIHTLDLGSSKIDKSILKEVARYENLQRLYLDNTDVDDDMISSIRKLEKLQYLNLYGSKVSKAGVDRMLKIASLEQLYIWQTALDTEQIAALQQDHPDIEINGGLPQNSDFATAQLVTPKVDFASSFFDQQMAVDVSYNLSDTKLFYQFDGSEPQLLTNGQITIKESGKFSVYAQKEGWEDSPLVEQVFIKVAENNIKKSSLRYEPKGNYTAKGVSTLFDLSKGDENFRDGQWLGFAGDDLIVDVELRDNREISSVFISTLDDIGSWIFPPTHLEVWGGNDLDNLVKLQELAITKPEGPEPKHMIIHELAFDAKKLKHIRVRAKNYGDLPEWHPGTGTPAWMFIDEVAFN